MFKLREISKDDIANINKWRNSKELISCLGATFRYINLDVDYKWYESYMQNRSSTIRCAIVKENEEENILGLVSLTNIDHLNQTAEFHIMIGDEANRGLGMGYFAAKEILYHAFQNMNLNRVELSVLEDNLIGLKLYEKVGFIKEGIRRNSVYKDGKFVNYIMMGILKNEFLNLHII